MNYHKAPPSGGCFIERCPFFKAQSFLRAVRVGFRASEALGGEEEVYDGTEFSVISDPVRTIQSSSFTRNQRYSGRGLAGDLLPVTTHLRSMLSS